MTSLWKLWEAAADRCATKTVVIDADTGCEWTCHELTTLAERIAAPLNGRIVPICQPNSAFWLAAFLGVQKIGAAALPLDPSLPTEAQKRAVRHASRGLPARSCCIKLTSGTTGELKLVYCSAANLRADGKHIIRTMGIRPADRNLAVIPLGHSYGLGNLVMPLLLQGTAVVCAQMFVPRQILQWIEQYQVSVLPTVPAVLRALAQLEGAAKPPSLRLVISAGAPLSAEVARQFHQRYGIKIHNFYGSSETAPATARCPAVASAGHSTASPSAFSVMVVSPSAAALERPRCPIWANGIGTVNCGCSGASEKWPISAARRFRLRKWSGHCANSVALATRGSRW